MTVEMREIDKRFGNVVALDNIDIQVRQGSIHAIVGENGAGKTTLMRILYGACQADTGSIVVEGKPVSFHNSAEAIKAGIGMVSQHYSIIGELTCLQNLMLGAEPGAILNLQAARARADELAKQMGFSFQWDAPASTLGPAGAQKLEILKLLWREARIMILDEPTAMLSPSDGDALFASLRQLTDAGATVLLVTHRLPEVMSFCESVTVLRGGKLIFDRTVQEVTSDELAEGIVGHAISAPAPRKEVFETGDALRIENLVVVGARGNEAVKGVNLTVKKGEVVGIAGVDGSGQRELFHALAGLIRVKSGAINLENGNASGWPTKSFLSEGVRLLPEDRHEEGVIETWSLEENAALGHQRNPVMARGTLVAREGRRVAATAFAERFNTKHGGLNLPMSSLSGGNQQRFVAARSLAFDPRLILAFQPARGLDIDATVNVYQGIREACNAGAGALVVSYDLDELLEHCDRVVAMSDGRIFEPAQRDRAEIGRLMVGVA